MSWFQSTNFASLAKTALKEAQKTIDKALDINEEEHDGSATRNNQSGGGGIGRNFTSAAVSGMASDFFASWGVGAEDSNASSSTSASVISSSNTTSELEVLSESSSSSNNESSLAKNKTSSSLIKSAISSNRTAVVNDFINDEDEDNEIIITERTETALSANNVPSKKLGGILTSLSSPQLYPVTSESSRGNVESQNQKQTCSLDPSGSFNSEHIDSGYLKCDFVEEPFDTNGSSLVQSLDEDSAVKLSGGWELERPASPFSNNSSSSAATTVKCQSSTASVTSSSLVSVDAIEVKDDKLVELTTEESNKPATAVMKAELCQNKENVELQEIDLNTGNDDVHEWNEDETNPCSSVDDINIPIETTLVSVRSVSISNAVTESSSTTLSDGWDWTSGTESYLNSQDDQKNASEKVYHQTGSKEILAVTEEKESESHEKLLQTEPLMTDHKVEPVDSSLHFSTVDSDVKGVQNSQLLPADDVNRHSVLQSSSSVPSCDNSSRPLISHIEHDQGQTEHSTSSSFELVSNSIVGSSCPQPESSRSSSIVVVSGRDSTPNSGGTSAGSSEGGHDHDDGVDGGSSHHSSGGGVEFGRVRRHKKVASSSSSSDIEVIPSDYSSSSPSALNERDREALIPSSSLKNHSSCPSAQIQSTSLQPAELRDCEVQTDPIEEVGDIPISEEQLSKYVSTKIADILAEKEQEVLQLREEGEKLSVKQYDLSQVIKKLRAKEKETEGVVKGLRTEMATKNLELEKLMKTFISKEGIEQCQNDTISKLSQERLRLELKVEQLNSELEDARDNVDSMKATVENTSIEILELKNVISSVQRESAEVDRLTRDKAELTSRADSLQKEVDHLRSVLNTSQKTHHSREAELKFEISNLTQKVHHLENSLSDISSEVADATMPLSIEIEKLQGELKQQSVQYDRREQALQSTIADLELRFSSASEREKIAKDMQVKYQSQNSTLELRAGELEAENRNLKEQLIQKEEIFRKKMEDKSAHYRKLEKTVERLTGELERLSGENTELALQTERTSLEAEVRRNQSLTMDNNSNREMCEHPHRSNSAYHKRTSSMSTTASSTGGSQNSSSQRTTVAHDHDSQRSSDHSPSDHSIAYEENSYLDEVFDPNTGMMIGGGGSDNLNNRSMTPKSFFESFSSANLIENLQGQLRLREGELVALQDKLSKNEKIRKQLNEEIANLTMQNQQLEVEMEKMSEMQQKLNELDKNYNAVLQMYGEKVEEADELRMDLEDVKEMYKTQIQQLLQKS